MQVVSTSPLRVGSLVWQPWPRVWALSVFCKATFLLAPGTSQLAEVQEEPTDEEGYWDDDPQRSLYAPNDFVPVKPRADVLLVGHAFAPGGRPTRSLVVRFVVGDIDKRIEVWCDRVFWHQGQILEAQPFVKMPLRYERAGGGPRTWNPVGLRHDAPPDAHGSVRIPNLHAVGAAVLPGQPITPIGLGPIAPMWPGRYEKSAGLAGQTWHERVMPQGFDNTFFNAAPWDQQAPGIRPDERIYLENLHPVYEKLETRLPGVVPRAIVRGPARQTEPVPLVADTLWIDTDRGIATLVWRGRIMLADRAEPGEVVIGAEGDDYLDQRGTNEETAYLAPKSGPSKDESLPFAERKSPWANYKRPESKFVAPHQETGTVPGLLAPGREALPFVEGIKKPPVWPPEPPLPSTETNTPVDEVKAETKAAESTNTSEPIKTEEKSLETLLEEFPITRCAALKASMAMSKEKTADILEENELKSAQWDEVDQHWQNAIRSEIEKSKTHLLSEFDAAYVAQIEKERSPIDIDVYARLIVAGERGTQRALLDSLGIPKGAMTRIERVWMARLANDSTLLPKVTDAVSNERAN